ncbi:peptide/nickel transport system ATP-binding protein [Rhizobiales bacterium GAS191]|nr:peptide/nickel transport system ATP-binding protein [Rhizobiales bacterium GAS191]
MTELALEARGLTKIFGGGHTLGGRPRLAIHAVSDVTIALTRGKTLGIVGESGCGKSTLARMLVGLIRPSVGTISVNGQILVGENSSQHRVGRRAIQYVFQDPVSSLNPRKTIRKILEAPLIRLARLDRKQLEERLVELMDAVKLRPEFIDRYPHEFSGGQAQRIGIARALAANPDIVILDEPVSALDVSVQAQILSLLTELKQRFRLTYVFISHNLAVTEAISDDVAVMYFGRIVEQAPARQLFENPHHPYTRLLLDSAPVIGRKTKGTGIEIAELPDPYNPPIGCAFAARCSNVGERCRCAAPDLTRMAENHEAACFYPFP